MLKMLPMTSNACQPKLFSKMYILPRYRCICICDMMLENKEKLIESSAFLFLHIWTKLSCGCEVAHPEVKFDLTQCFFLLGDMDDYIDISQHGTPTPLEGS